MNQIQKSKDIAVKYLSYFLHHDYYSHDEAFDQWLDTTEAKQLLSGEEDGWGGLYEQLESIDNYLNGGGRLNGDSQLHRDIKETIKKFKPIKVKKMDKTILFVGFNPDGEADFAVSGLVNKLSVEEMNRLRQMIVVSIGRLEELWRLNFNRVRTDGNATSTVHFGGHTSANNPELPKNLNQ